VSTTGRTFHPVFFDAGRAVHLMNQQAGYTYCGLAGGRVVWMATVTLDVPNGCRRCVATVVEGSGPNGAAA